MYKVAVIILHFGDVKNTIECLKSLKKNRSKFTFKTFIIDNGTNKIKSKYLKTILPNSNFIFTAKNLGFSKAFNIAIRKALKEKFDYMILLNNDIVIEKHSLDELLNPFKNPEIGITGPLITYYSNPKKIWFAGGYLNKFFCFTTHPKMNKNIDNESIKSKYVDFITGAAMAIKKDVFEKIGLLDEEYFLYWEDVDFCFRAKKAKFKSFFVKEAIVKHKVSSSSGIKGSNRLTPTRSYYYARNPFIFIKKNGLNKFSGILGQIIIRMPFYSMRFENLENFKSYIKGMKTGINLTFK